MIFNLNKKALYNIKYQEMFTDNKEAHEEVKINEIEEKIETYYNKTIKENGVFNKDNYNWSYVNILDTKSQTFYAALLANNSH